MINAVVFGKDYGFQVVCNCECHNKKIVLGESSSFPNTINSPLNRNGEYVYQ